MWNHYKIKCSVLNKHCEFHLSVDKTVYLQTCPGQTHQKHYSASLFLQDSVECSPHNQSFCWKNDYLNTEAQTSLCYEWCDFMTQCMKPTQHFKNRITKLVVISDYYTGQDVPHPCLSLKPFPSLILQFFVLEILFQNIFFKIFIIFF